MFWVF